MLEWSKWNDGRVRQKTMVFTVSVIFYYFQTQKPNITTWDVN